MIKFPFTSLQQLNLDWIMQTLHKILDIIPMNGVAGDVLQRTVDGAAWRTLAAVSLYIHSMTAMTDAVAGNDELPIYDDSLQGNYKVTVSDLMLQAPVQSVNTQTGDVVLTAADVGALSDTTVIPTDTSDLTNNAGFVDAAGAAAAAPVQSVNGQTGAVIVSGGAVDSVNGQTGTVILGKSDVGLGNVDNVQQYSASNPPPYPVTSVNGQTGTVVIGGGSGMTFTLLWTNSHFPDYLSQYSFSSQTIALDLTGYKLVLIETWSASSFLHYHLLAVPTPSAINPFYIAMSDWVNGKMYERSCVVSTSGIEFESGGKYDTYDGALQPDDYRCQPCRIWGIT